MSDSDVLPGWKYDGFGFWRRGTLRVAHRVNTEREWFEWFAEGSGWREAPTLRAAMEAAERMDAESRATAQGREEFERETALGVAAQINAAPPPDPDACLCGRTDAHDLARECYRTEFEWQAVSMRPDAPLRGGEISLPVPEEFSDRLRTALAADPPDPDTDAALARDLAAAYIAADLPWSFGAVVDSAFGDTPPSSWPPGGPPTFRLVPLEIKPNGCPGCGIDFPEAIATGVLRHRDGCRRGSRPLLDAPPIGNPPAFPDPHACPHCHAPEGALHLDSCETQRAPLPPIRETYQQALQRAAPFGLRLPEEGRDPYRYGYAHAPDLDGPPRVPVVQSEPVYAGRACPSCGLRACMHGRP